jgi:hypothetical protein
MVESKELVIPQETEMRFVNSIGYDYKKFKKKNRKGYKKRKVKNRNPQFGERRNLRLKVNKYLRDSLQIRSLNLKSRKTFKDFDFRKSIAKQAILKVRQRDKKFIKFLGKFLKGTLTTMEFSCSEEYNSSLYYVEATPAVQDMQNILKSAIYTPSSLNFSELRMILKKFS